MPEDRKNCLPVVLAMIVFAVSVRRCAGEFTPGDLVVTTYGSSGATLTHGAPTPLTLSEFSTSGGEAVLTDTLPVTDGVGGAGNLGMVGQYGSSSEGAIQLTATDNT